HRPRHALDGRVRRRGRQPHRRVQRHAAVAQQGLNWLHPCALGCAATSQYRRMSLRSAAPALLAALLFGASTPLAKLLTGDVSPLLLAGLLYLGSGAGLAALLLVRRLGASETGTLRPSLRIPSNEWPWLLGAIVTGGMLGPALLMLGLSTTDAASASLLLNIEGVLTAVLAWLVFKVNADRQVVFGIVLRGVLLDWKPGGSKC